MRAGGGRLGRAATHILPTRRRDPKPVLLTELWCTLGRTTRRLVGCRRFVNERLRIKPVLGIIESLTSRAAAITRAAGSASEPPERCPIDQR